MVVDLRLLIASLAAAALLLASCSVGPIWAPELRGQVVDGRTGAPVAGAGVFASYTWEVAHHWDIRWTRTDAEGRFVIPGHIATIAHWGPLTIAADVRGPYMKVVHPAYGALSFGQAAPELYTDEREWTDLQNLRLEIVPETDTMLRKIQKDPILICLHYTQEVCLEMCRIMRSERCRE